MICKQLLTAGFPRHALEHGAKMDDPTRLTDLDSRDLQFFYLGKETCIENMMEGGTGWPHHTNTLISFGQGCGAERYDRASYLRWFANLHSCIQDLQAGKVG